MNVTVVFCNLTVPTVSLTGVSCATLQTNTAEGLLYSDKSSITMVVLSVCTEDIKYLVANLYLYHFVQNAISKLPKLDVSDTANPEISPLFPFWRRRASKLTHRQRSRPRSSPCAEVDATRSAVSVAATMDLQPSPLELSRGGQPPVNRDDPDFSTVPEDRESSPSMDPCPLDECGTLPSLATIKDSLAIAERLAQASLMTSPAAKRRLQARRMELGLGEDPEYVPPKHLLLYLVR
ncbi:Nocturnin [Homalodisca vitripennis]|nr:Nocturnin [Homalodisca vitripennis]